MALSEKELKELHEIDIDRYFHECMNGGEAYKVLEKMITRWERETGDFFFVKLQNALYTKPKFEQEWALSIKEMIEERKDGNRSYIYDYIKEPMGDSCSCKELKKHDPTR
jgi:hypothetical protein